MKKILFITTILLSSSIYAHNFNAEVKAEPLSTIGVKGSEIDLATNHYAYVKNNYDQVKFIHVRYTLCATNKGCDDSHNYKIKVQPHTEWRTQPQYHKYETYMQPGTYQLKAITQVSGDDGLYKYIENTANISIR